MTPIQCGSRVPSDIRVLRPFGFPNPVTNVTPINCAVGITDSLLVTVLFPLTQGSNQVIIKTGNDGNSLLGLCGTAIQPYRDTLELIIADNSQWQPAVDSLGCIFNQKTITFNENIFCWTIAVDASDLLLKDATGTVIPIANAYGYCSPNGEQSNQMLITFNGQQVATGPVYLTVKTGNDGNTIANQCGRFLNVGDTLAIFYINNKIDVSLGSDLSICDNAPAPTLNSGFNNTLTYQWSFNGGVITGATNSSYTIAQPLVAGNYSLNLYLTANPSCQGTDTVLLTVNLTPVVALGPDANVCAGSAVILHGGSIGLGYTYQWYFNGNGLPGETLESYSPTVNGTYTVLVSNGNCFASDDIQVAFFPAPVVPLFNNQNQTVCTGAAIAALSADNPGSSYQWSVDGNPVSGATSQTFTPSTAVVGQYNISVIVSIPGGGSNCSATGMMVLTVAPYPTLNVSPQHVCVGAAAPTFDATGSNPAGVTYSWTDQGGNVVSSTNTFTPSSTSTPGPQTYTITATNAPAGITPPGCVVTQTVTFTVDDLPTVDAGSYQPFCELSSATLTATSTATNFLWNTNQTSQSITINAAAGNYTYTVTVTDANNCVSSDTATIVIESALNTPTVYCNLGNADSSIHYKFVYTWAAISGAAGYDVDEGLGAGWVSANNVGNPVNPTSHGTDNAVPHLKVRAVNSSLSGLCKEGNGGEATPCPIVIPNIITPNGDHVNDVFTISNIEQYPNNHMTILNRWGKEVYSHTYDNNSNVFKGTDLPDGVYFYILEYGDGQTKPSTGTVTINSGK